MLALYAGSGLTQAEFCRRDGINYHTFVAWLGRRRKGRFLESKGIPGFRRINRIHGTNPHRTGLKPGRRESVVNFS